MKAGNSFVESCPISARDSGNRGRFVHESGRFREFASFLLVVVVVVVLCVLVVLVVLVVRFLLY